MDNNFPYRMKSVHHTKDYICEILANLRRLAEGPNVRRAAGSARMRVRDRATTEEKAGL